MRERILINSSADNAVLIFDSGVGGLPYLERARRELPGEYFYYIADNKNYPYGQKEAAYLTELILSTMGKAIDFLKPKCIVVACNTASVVALAALRERYSLPFIGVVPAVKPAAESASRRKFGVLATLRTTKEQYLSKLIDSFAGNCDVSVLPSGRLRDLVEERFFTTTREEKIAEIKEVTRQLDLEGLDSIVLGCTHFIHLENEFREVLDNGIRIVDSREGVIRQLGRILDKEGLRGNNRGENRMYITENKDSGRFRLFAEKYELNFAGVLGEETVYGK